MGGLQRRIERASGKLTTKERALLVLRA